MRIVSEDEAEILEGVGHARDNVSHEEVSESHCPEGRDEDLLQNNEQLKPGVSVEAVEGVDTSRKEHNEQQWAHEVEVS